MLVLTCNKRGSTVYTLEDDTNMPFHGRCHQCLKRRHDSMMMKRPHNLPLSESPNFYKVAPRSPVCLVDKFYMQPKQNLNKNLFAVVKRKEIHGLSKDNKNYHSDRIVEPTRSNCETEREASEAAMVSRRQQKMLSTSRLSMTSARKSYSSMWALSTSSAMQKMDVDKKALAHMKILADLRFQQICNYMAMAKNPFAVSRNALKARISTRVAELALPRKCKANCKEPNLFKVSPNALRAKATARIKQLAKPKSIPSKSSKSPRRYLRR